MKVLYFIVCLLLVACGGDNQPEVNQPFELKNIIVGDQQNQQTFENVAPNVAIVLEFSDAVDEASARNNIALKHEELPISCDYEFLQEKKVSYLQPIITQYFIDNKSEIWLLFLIAHSKR